MIRVIKIERQTWHYHLKEDIGSSWWILDFMWVDSWDIHTHFDIEHYNNDDNKNNNNKNETTSIKWHGRKVVTRTTLD